MVVLFVLCIGVSVLCCWCLMYVCIFLVKFRQLSGHLMGKKAAHFSTSVFVVGIFFLIAPFPDLCLHVPFLYETNIGLLSFSFGLLFLRRSS